MTLILKLDLDMVKTYLQTKDEVFYVKGFKSYSLNRHKHRHTRLILLHVKKFRLVEWDSAMNISSFQRNHKITARITNRIPEFDNARGDGIVDFTPINGWRLPFQIPEVHIRRSSSATALEIKRIYLYLVDCKIWYDSVLRIHPYICQWDPFTLMACRFDKTVWCHWAG